MVSIRDIEQTLYNTFADLAERVFINNSPPALDSPVNSYIVVDVANNVIDRGPYYDSYCYVYVNVRKRESGVQDSVKIDEIVNGVLSKLPICNDLFSMFGPSIGFGHNRGEFVETSIRCDVIIKQ